HRPAAWISRVVPRGSGNGVVRPRGSHPVGASAPRGPRLERLASRGAGIRCGGARAIPSVFISHAYPTPLSPPLDFNLSILEGNAAVDARRQKGPVKGDVLLAGLEGESAPIDPRRFERPEPAIGIFPPKVLSWPTFAAIVDDCRRHFR